MSGFRIFMAILFVSIVAYTAVTISNHGWNLVPVCFGDMKALAWPGPVNFDIRGCLLLTGFWVAWRHHFSIGGLGLGLLAVFGGIMFLSAYLFVASLGSNGSVQALLMGKSRAAS